MKNLITVILLMWFMVSCGQEELSRTSFQAQETQETSGNNQTENNDQVTPPAETSTSDQEPIEPETSKCGSLAEDDCLMVSALYRHCASCHAIGNKRFIFDDSFENTLEYITTVNYEENTTWAKSIRDSIDWVDGKIPEYDTQRDGEKQFMPLGKKRQHMNEETVGGKAIQEIMLEALNKYAK